MTQRQIFDEYVKKRNKNLDRMPRIEYAPYWSETTDEWYKQGLDVQIKIDRIQKHFGLDPLWYTSIDPTGDGFVYPDHGAPAVFDEADYERILPTIYPEKPTDKVMDFIMARKKESEKGDFMFELNLNGFFWWPRTILGIENHLVSFYDNPEFYHRICKDLLEYNIRVVKEFMQYASPAFVILGEDMSYNHGSMISKAIWDDFLKPYYLEFLCEMKKLGQTVIFDSDGKIDGIIPWLNECGFDGILPLERMAGVDVVTLSKTYPDFIFIGGFDKTVMKNGRDAMRAEFERILPAIKNGNYIPCVDHQTPPDVTIENYKNYIELLYEYTQFK